MPTEPQSDNPLPPPRKTTLFAFVEENQKLLTVLGVFTALTVFAASLPLKPLGSILSFLFMTLTVILWQELLERFPAKAAGWRMSWFESLLSLAVLMLMFYWLVDYRDLWQYWLAILVLAPLLWGVSKIMNRFDVFNRVFHAKPGAKRPLRYIVWVLFFAGALLAAILVTGFLTPPLNRLFDSIARSMTAAPP